MKTTTGRTSEPSRTQRAAILRRLIRSLEHAVTHPTRALVDTREALATAKRLKDPSLIAECLLVSSKIALEQDDTITAAKLASKAIAKFDTLRDRDAWLDARYQYELVRLEEGRVLESLIGCLAIYDERDTPLRLSQHIRTWEDRVLGRTPSARSQEHARLAKLSAVCNAIGRGYGEIGDHHNALKCMQQSLELARTLGDHPRVAMQLNNIGIVYTLNKNFPTACRYVQQAVRINRRTGDLIRLAGNYKNLSNAYFESGAPALGKRYIQKAISIYQTLGQHASIASCYIMLSDYELTYGKSSRAIAPNRKAQELLATLSHGHMHSQAAYQSLQIALAIDPASGAQTYRAMVALRARTRSRYPGLDLEIVNHLYRLAERQGNSVAAIRWLRIRHTYELEALQVSCRRDLDRLVLSHEITTREVAARQAKSIHTLQRTELSALASMIAHNNTTLQTVVRRLSKLRYEPDTSGRTLLDSAIRTVEAAMTSDREYQDLERKARELFPEFFDTISSCDQVLTKAEERVCTLIRLGLPATKVASVLNTSVRTIETHCLHIRRKLRIPRGKLLSTALRSIAVEG